MNGYLPMISNLMPEKEGTMSFFLLNGEYYIYLIVKFGVDSQY
jgi:hypothetical protein